jgi:hypothetical protein
MRFPARVKHFPARPQKFPCNCRKASVIKSLKLRQKLWDRAADLAGIPCKIPCSRGISTRDGFAADCVISQAVRSPDCVFPRTGKRPPSRRLGWPAPVSGQQFLAFRSFWCGFRAPVSACFIPISVSGEGRLVRLLPETGSKNAVGPTRDYNSLGRLFC